MSEKACFECGCPDLTWTVDCFRCDNCFVTQTQSRWELDDEAWCIGGTLAAADNRTRIVIEQGPKRDEIIGKPLADMVSREDLVRRSTEVLVQMAYTCSDYLRLPLPDVQARLKVVWSQWLKLAQDPACFSISARCTGMKGRGYRRRAGVHSSSVIMGPALPALSKDLLLALLWMSLVNCGATVLPVDVAKWPRHGPLKSLFSSIENAVPRSRTEYFKSSSEAATMATGATIQKVAADLVRNHQFKVTGFDIHALVPKLIAASGLTEFADKVGPAARALLLLSQRRQSLEEASRNGYATTLKIVGSKEAADGVYLLCDLHNSHPMYQRCQPSGTPVYLYWHSFEPLGAGWYSAYHPELLEKMDMNVYFEFWHGPSSTEATCKFGGRGDAGGSVIPENTQCDNLRQFQVSSSTKDANGVYTFCGNHGGMPVFLRRQIRGEPTFFYFCKDHNDSGWCVGVHPAISSTDAYRDLWEDLGHVGRHGGVVETLLSPKLAVVRKVLRITGRHHPLGNMDIFAAGAVLAAAELTGVLETAQSKQAEPAADDDPDLRKQACYLPSARQKSERQKALAPDASDGDPAFLKKAYCRLTGSQKQLLWDFRCQRKLANDAIDTPAIREINGMSDILERARQQQDHEASQAEAAQHVSTPENEPLCRPPLDRKRLSLVLTRCIRGAAPRFLVQPRTVRKQIVKFANKAKIWKRLPNSRCFGQSQGDPLPPGLPMCLCPEFNEQLHITVSSFLARTFGRQAESGLLVPWRRASKRKILRTKRKKYVSKVYCEYTRRV